MDGEPERRDVLHRQAHEVQLRLKAVFQVVLQVDKPTYVPLHDKRKQFLEHGVHVVRRQQMRAALPQPDAPLLLTRLPHQKRW